MASHQHAVGDCQYLPVIDFFIVPTEALEFIFYQERHDVGQTDSGLLAVAEPCYALAFDNRLAIDLRVAKYTRRVTDRTDRLTGAVERLDQGDGLRIFGKVP